MSIVNGAIPKAKKKKKRKKWREVYSNPRARIEQA